MGDTNNKNRNFNQRALLAIGLTAAACWVFAYLATNVFKDYEVGLFIWLPFVLGAASTLLYGYNNNVRKRKLFGISMWTLLVFCIGLLTFAWEGLICMIMAFPIGLFFTWIGHWMGYQILKRKVGNTSTTILLLFLSVPSLMAFQNADDENEDIRFVTTSIEINATPEQIWRNVVAFPELKEPTEFVFQTGIAYPINATIQGHGVGSVRKCNFSTGSFVEPITVWEEPRLLRFSVESQPDPTHLQGYWVSKQGQFRLIQLPNGNTLLEGTTWYVNKIKPGIYWAMWSDYIIHKIHKRVLEHIKIQAEVKANQAAANLTTMH
jgi:hypothetical protein